MELVIRLAVTQPDPSGFLKSMFESVSAKLDQSPPELARKLASSEEAWALSTFFSLAEKAVRQVVLRALRYLIVRPYARHQLHPARDKCDNRQAPRSPSGGQGHAKKSGTLQTLTGLRSHSSTAGAQVSCDSTLSQAVKTFKIGS
jgi:hypothetical protein